MQPTPTRPFLPAALDASPAMEAVLEFARDVHEGQERDDGAPFIVHPLEAAALLDCTAHRPPVVAAALLHDAALYAADKLSKARELRALRIVSDARDPGPGEARMGHYRQSLAMLERQTPEHPLVRQPRQELDTL